MTMQAASQAVVIGGSMAGLFTARVLSDHFARVIVIERDSFPDTAEFRNGVPQARHVHALLARGQRIMEDMFPGLAEDFKEIGAPRIEWGTDTAFLTPGGWVKRFATGYQTNLISRIALEHLIRKRLALRRNVEFLPETDVLDLIASEDKGTVVGVNVQSRRDKSEAGHYPIMGDMVVDASGRNSKAPEWLTALGYDAPSVSTVYAYIGYATRWYEAPAGKHDWKVLFINARPEQGLKRGAGIFEVEGGQWVATLGGLNRDYPPTDEAGFLAYAKTVATPAFYEAIKDAKPISPIYGYRYDGNRLRHYEKMTRRPENFLVIGDAVCGFNPLYGQGMTVAALEALRLGELITAHKMRSGSLKGLAGSFQKALAGAVRNPWLMATGEDMRYPETEGPKPNAFSRLVQRYINQVNRAMPNDEQLSLAFIETSNLTRPPTGLLSPRLVLRVLGHMVRGKKASATEQNAIPIRPVGAVQG